MTHENRTLPLTLLLLLSTCLGAAGCKSYLAFGTATTFGLDASQRADQTVDITMGYKRVEVASIPVEEGEEDECEAPAAVPEDAEENALGVTPDASASDDAYSVLGSFQVKYGNPFTEGLVLKQLFATGMVARQVAENEKMQEMFGTMATKIFSGGEEE